jgi:ATP-dependent helicase/nuclease subunit A
LEPGAEFNLQLLFQNEIQGEEKTEDKADAVMQAVAAGQPLPDTEKRDMVRQRLDWHYDSRGLGQVSAKVTVTELKARSWEEIDREEPYGRPVLMGEGSNAAPVLEEEWGRPGFLQQKQETQKKTA